jgi:hypothetical protein
MQMEENCHSTWQMKMTLMPLDLLQNPPVSIIHSVVFQLLIL